MVDLVKNAAETVYRVLDPTNLEELRNPIYLQTKLMMRSNPDTFLGSEKTASADASFASSNAVGHVNP